MPAAHGPVFNSTLRRRLVSDLRRRQQMSKAFAGDEAAHRLNGPIWMLALAVLCLRVAPVVRALPIFALQTGQSCVACHAGGQFPKLTPYGRMFRLNGYTFGKVRYQWP
jgi:hypothetical protein